MPSTSLTYLDSSRQTWGCSTHILKLIFDRNDKIYKKRHTFDNSSLLAIERDNPVHYFPALDYFGDLENPKMFLLYGIIYLNLVFEENEET